MEDAAYYKEDAKGGKKSKRARVELEYEEETEI